MLHFANWRQVYIILFDKPTLRDIHYLKSTLHSLAEPLFLKVCLHDLQAKVQEREKGWVRGCKNRERKWKTLEKRNEEEEEEENRYTYVAYVLGTRYTVQPCHLSNRRLRIESHYGRMVTPTRCCRVCSLGHIRFAHSFSFLFWLYYPEARLLLSVSLFATTRRLMTKRNLKIITASASRGHRRLAF